MSASASVAGQQRSQYLERIGQDIGNNQIRTQLKGGSSVHELGDDVVAHSILLCGDDCSWIDIQPNDPSRTQPRCCDAQDARATTIIEYGLPAPDF